MAQVRRRIVEVLLASTIITEIMSEATNNFLGNILSAMLPAEWAKSPFIPIITIILLILFHLWQKAGKKRIDTDSAAQSHSLPKGTTPSTHLHLHYNNYPMAMPTNSIEQPSLPAAPLASTTVDSVLLPTTTEARVTPTSKTAWQTKATWRGAATSKALLATLPSFPMEIRYTRELPEQPRMIYWSPDGACLAALFYGRAPHLINKPNKPMPEWGEVQALCWSPDGNTLAISANGVVHFWDITHGKESIAALDLRTRSIYSLDWSVQGELAIWVEDQIQIFTFPALSTVYTISTQEMRSRTIGQLRWSPDGTWLVAGSREKHKQGSLLYWSRESEDNYWLSSPAGVQHMAWKPNSAQLVIIFGNMYLEVWDIARQQQLLASEKLPITTIHSISISRDNYLAAALLENELYIQQLTPPFAASKYPGHKVVAWSPPGSELATFDGQTNMLHICASHASTR